MARPNRAQPWGLRMLDMVALSGIASLPATAFKYLKINMFSLRTAVALRTLATLL
jgi:hypothetical protein